MGDVTVVIPYWNLDPGILRTCIDSVRTQSHDCDILVIDNKSSVPVPPMAGVRVERLSKRVSVGMARTLGLRHVTTPYVMFLDADDVLLPDAISHLRKLVDSRKGASVAAGGIVDWIDETGYQSPKAWPSGLAHRINRFARPFRALNVMRNVTPITGCALIDTEMARTSAGFPDSTAEDWTFGVAMSFRGPVVLSKQQVKLYRWRADGLSKQAVEDWRALYEARRVTRDLVRTDSHAPLWMKSLLPLLFLIHVLELPFHVRRERIFGNVRRNAPVPQRDVVTPSVLVPRPRLSAMPRAFIDIPASQGSAALAGVAGGSHSPTTERRRLLKE